MTNDKTICTVCNYIYDQSGRTKFSDLPENWCCPECGSSKDMFQPCSCVSLADTSLAAQPLGQLVTKNPSRASVLEQYGLDYCCGGKVTLEDACKKKGLPINEVIGKIIDADRNEKKSATSEPDWTKTSLKELIDHIVNTYHQPLRPELSRISQLAEKVAKVHGRNHPEMVEVQRIFKDFREELELHMQKEEMILFPGIIKIEAGASPKSFGCGGSIEHPIEMMTQEHDSAGDALSKMRQLTDNYRLPADACNTYRVLLDSLSKLESAMHQHVHKENSILFPRTLALSKPVNSSL